MPNTISVDNARQGLVSGRIIWVLGVSTVLALTALFVVWLFFAPEMNHTNAPMNPTRYDVQHSHHRSAVRLVAGRPI
jgi:hypothetical protein